MKFPKSTLFITALFLSLSLYSFNNPVYLVEFESCGTSGEAGMTQQQLDNFIAFQTKICGVAPKVTVKDEK